MILAFAQAEAKKRLSYTEPMIEIRFKSDQKVRPLLRPAIALGSLRGDECLICIFRKRGCVQGERRARHDKLGERLLSIAWLTSQKMDFLHKRREIMALHSTVLNW
jgi:hypothetical protein